MSNIGSLYRLPSVTFFVISLSTRTVRADALSDQQAAAAHSWLLRHNHASGPGGLGNHFSAAARKLLADIFVTFHIKSMVDIPCGDWEYMQWVNLTGVDYHGFDISKVLIQRHQRRFLRPGVQFDVLNLVTTVPPKADLVLSREMWFHVRPEVGARALRNVRASGARYQITSTHPDVKANKIPTDLWGHGRDWGYYDINVELTPFNLSRTSIVAQTKESMHWATNPQRYLRMYDLHISAR